MTIHLYNTLAREKEIFTPIDAANVRLYVCGPTVYDYAHIGNARPVVVFDVLNRLLRHVYGDDHVRYVRNITDVDDKIIAAAAGGGEAIADVTERTEKAFHEDMAALGATAPDVEPRATEHIAQMIAMIGKLTAAGHAYAADGHVLFAVKTMRNYGRLSRRSADEMIAGARVEVAPYKRDPADFVLWKPSSAEQPGWDSPWGRGRPGWHIECSAMSEKHLGVTFDIHGGGQDLIFPHHENEIAQSTCAHGGSPFVKYWMHNGYVMVEGEKMSKSLGNFYTVHDLLKDFPGEAIRLTLLQTHYRQPLDFRKDALCAAKETLDDFYRTLRQGGDVQADLDGGVPQDILDALCDDLNTPQAIAHLHALRHAMNVAGDDRARARAKGDLLMGGALLGILGRRPAQWFDWQPAGQVGLDAARIEEMIEKRLQARAARDFTKADAIRDELKAHGILLEDADGATTWRRN
ncbi:cysteine--tRNA ligase [Varunaivibrio sulfuroxidans]|uniref:Cysteine--tRNA ligase n=1 Tax=Varunaivibrio sulfuroxidans TaxID=1773489 RepID=A0A4R3J5P7_9PROT|nr:cysteine--tRNA ligase [Varunaivibrio sulfuroxidans]TCS60584.1 cysteinyl-tRNA synthetase [Varunaivibrio sulfuroxidans]WES30075.1 cysteine--tRNA ligase [Varunaivibrio sulfuroxidans]